MTYSPTFLHALCQLHVIPSSFHWLTALYVSFVIDLSTMVLVLQHSIENCSNSVFMPVSFNFCINIVQLITVKYLRQQCILSKHSIEFFFIFIALHKRLRIRGFTFYF